MVQSAEPWWPTLLIPLPISAKCLTIKKRYSFIIASVAAVAWSLSQPFPGWGNVTLAVASAAWMLIFSPAEGHETVDGHIPNTWRWVMAGGQRSTAPDLLSTFKFDHKASSFFQAPLITFSFGFSSFCQTLPTSKSQTDHCPCWKLLFSCNFLLSFYFDLVKQQNDIAVATFAATDILITWKNISISLSSRVHKWLSVRKPQLHVVGVWTDCFYQQICVLTFVQWLAPGPEMAGEALLTYLKLCVLFTSACSGKFYSIVHTSHWSDGVIFSPCCCIVACSCG